MEKGIFFLALCCILSRADVGVYIEDDAGTILFGRQGDVNLYRKDDHTLKSDDSLEIQDLVAASANVQSLTTSSSTATSVTTSTLSVSSTAQVASLTASVVRTASIAHPTFDTIQLEANVTGASNVEIQTGSVRAAGITTAQLSHPSGASGTVVVSGSLHGNADLAVDGSVEVAGTLTTDNLVAASLAHPSGATGTVEITAAVVHASGNITASAHVNTQALIASDYVAAGVVLASQSVIAHTLQVDGGASPNTLTLVGADGSHAVTLVGPESIRNSQGTAVQFDDGVTTTSVQASGTVNAGSVVSASVVHPSGAQGTLSITGQVKINSRNAYQLIMYADRCQVNETGDATVMSLLQYTSLQTLFGVEHLSAEVGGMLDTLTIPTSGVYKITVSPYTCAHEGYVRLNVTRAGALQYSQSYFALASCGNAPVVMIWDGYQSGDKVQILVSQTANPGGNSFPVDLDTSKLNDHTKCLVELIA